MYKPPEDVSGLGPEYRVTTTLTPDIHIDLLKMADANHINVSRLVRNMIEHCLLEGNNGGDDSDT